MAHAKNCGNTRPIDRVDQAGCGRAAATDRHTVLGNCGSLAFRLGVDDAWRLARECAVLSASLI